jgi:acetolactate decarboxylase
MSASDSRDVLYQTSTIGALLQGVYDGDTSVADLRARGDFGLGTINCLDGELVVLDGRFFTVEFSGKVRELAPDTLSPFAAVTWFERDLGGLLEDVTDLEALTAKLDRVLGSDNLCYAVRLTGRFDYIKTRSVPRQARPYLPLTDVVKGQAIFEFSDVPGTIVGFRMPPYVTGINVPGWHLHFLADDLSGGGHLLDCRFDEATAQIDETDGIMLDLPRTEGFLSCPLAAEEDDDADLHAVEQDPDQDG